MRTIAAERLYGATSEEDVVGIVRDYLGDWMPEELAPLPPHCRPDKIRDAEDINDLAFRLARERLGAAGDEAGAHLLAEMEAFMARATVRLAQIATRATVPAQDTQERASASALM